MCMSRLQRKKTVPVILVNFLLVQRCKRHAGASSHRFSHSENNTTTSRRSCAEMAATPTTSLHVDGPPARWLLSLLPRSDNAGGLVALVPLTLDIKATGDRPCVELSAVARVPCLSGHRLQRA